MKIFIILSLILILVVFYTSKSWVYAVGVWLIFAFIFAVYANIRAHNKSRELKGALKPFSESTKFPSDAPYVIGRLFIDNNYDEVGVIAETDGIYIYSVGVFSFFISWGKVDDFDLENESKCLTVSFFNGFERLKNVGLPWRSDFNVFLPNAGEGPDFKT